MGIFNRLFKIGEAKANDAVDKLEDPEVMFRQAIRDLKEKQDKAKGAQVKLKTAIVQIRTNIEKLRNTETEFKNKAGQLLDKVEGGSLDADKGNKLAIEALNRAENAKTEADALAKQLTNHEANFDKLTSQMQKFATEIKTAETELVNLKARNDVADASVAINKELSDIGTSDSAKSIMDKMKAKVEAKENEAEALAEIDEIKDVESEIDSILAGSSATDDNDLLAQFKANRNK